MPNLFTPDEGRRPEPIAPNRVLHEVDSRDLEAAADELRHRTMRLEPEEVLPAKWLIGSVVAIAGGIVTATFLFRREIRALLGLG